MKHLSTYIFLCITLTFSFLSWSQVEELVGKDSCYTAEVDVVFIDLDSYVSISYELEKMAALKLKIPEIQRSLDSMQITKDSIMQAHKTTSVTLTEMLALETQSKDQLKERVFNLQHNYNVVSTRAAKYKKQRNILGGTLGGGLALLIGILLIR